MLGFQIRIRRLSEVNMSKSYQHVTGGNKVRASVCSGPKPELIATILGCFPVEDTKIYVMVEIRARWQWTTKKPLTLSRGTWGAQEEGELHKGGDIWAGPWRTPRPSSGSRGVGWKHCRQSAWLGEPISPSKQQCAKGSDRTCAWKCLSVPWRAGEGPGSTTFWRHMSLWSYPESCFRFLVSVQSRDAEPQPPLCPELFSSHDTLTQIQCCP